MGLPNSECEEEIAILQEIYINELSVECNERNGFVRELSLQLHPATGEDVDQQYVCLTLHLMLPYEYPNALPEIVIKNPRGLADQHISSLKQTLADLAANCQGGPMLYELIEKTKESLTQCNLPHGQCMVCLAGFEHGQPFTRTPCYHYFHCQCLLRYITHCLAQLKSELEEAQRSNVYRHQPKEEQKQVVCPVCRETISHDVQSLDKGEIEDEVIKYKPSAEMRLIQQKMAKLFEVQKRKGGIIDLEEEKNKYLVPAGLVLTPSSNDLEGMATEVAASEETKSESTRNPEKPKSQQRPASSKSTENGQRRNRKQATPHDQGPRKEHQPHAAPASSERPSSSSGQRVRCRGRYGFRRQPDDRKKPAQSESALRKVNTWPKKSMAAEADKSDILIQPAEPKRPPPGFSRRHPERGNIAPPPGFHENR